MVAARLLLPLSPFSPKAIHSGPSLWRTRLGSRACSTRLLDSVGWHQPAGKKEENHGELRRTCYLIVENRGKPVSANSCWVLGWHDWKKLLRSSEYCVLMLKKRLGGKSHCDEGWNGMPATCHGGMHPTVQVRYKDHQRAADSFFSPSCFGISSVQFLGVSAVALDTGYAQLNLQLLMPIL